MAPMRNSAAAVAVAALCSVLFVAHPSAAAGPPCPLLQEGGAVIAQDLAGKTLRFVGVTPTITRRTEQGQPGPELRVVKYSSKPQVFVDDSSVSVSVDAACDDVVAGFSAGSAALRTAAASPAGWLIASLCACGFLLHHAGASRSVVRSHPLVAAGVVAALVALASNSLPITLAQTSSACEPVLEVEIVTAPPEECAICLTGCAPYQPTQDWIPTLEHMAQRCELMVHVGDTIPGSGVCNASVMSPPLEAFRSQGTPALYTIGDNECNDCHRRASQGIPAEFYKASEARQWHIDTFDIGNGTDLTGTLPVEAQSPACPFNAYVEKCGAAVVTLEVPGTLWYLGDETANYPEQNSVDPLEDRVAMYATAKNCALEWLDDSFAKAQAAGLHAILIFYHASFWESSGAQMGSSDDYGAQLYSGTWYNSTEALEATGGADNPYSPLAAKLLELADSYPDIMIHTGHADHHYWRMQSPLKKANFVNVMVEGSSAAMVSYAKFTIDESDPLSPISVKEVHVDAVANS